MFDLSTGGRVGELSTEQLDIRMVNYRTDRIFLGSSNGIIQCLREVDAEWPTIRSGGLEEKSDDAKKPAKEEEPAAADEPAPPADDPFGAFGTEPAAGSFGKSSGPLC